MENFVITTIQLNLVPNPSETERRQHCIEILLLALFLAATLDFTKAFLEAAHLFLQLHGLFFNLFLQFIIFCLALWLMLSGTYYAQNHTSRSLNTFHLKYLQQCH